MKTARRFFIWLIALLILSISVYVYFGFNGTPWGKYQQAASMQAYLSKKYHASFIIKSTDYNYLDESYQAYAYPTEHTDVLFMVQEDGDTKAGYSDTYPKVIWDTVYSSTIKEKITSIFPSLNKSTFNTEQVVERGEYNGPHTPTYEQVHASPLSCSVTINIRKDWKRMNEKLEMSHIQQLKQYLQTIHLPVLIEIRYYPKEIHTNEKVYYLTEDGQIVTR